MQLAKMNKLPKLDDSFLRDLRNVGPQDMIASGNTGGIGNVKGSRADAANGRARFRGGAQQPRAGAHRTEALRRGSDELRQGDRSRARLRTGAQQPRWALIELKRFEEAVTSCDKAIALEPDYAPARNIRGWALLELKRSKRQ